MYCNLRTPLYTEPVIDFAIHIETSHHQEGFMQHSKADWEAIYDSATGSNSEKSLAMLIEYSKISFGILGGAWGTTRSAFNRFFTMHWNRHHCDIVQKVIEPYLEERQLGASDFSHVLSNEAKSPGYLIFSINTALEKAGQIINPRGDLAIILHIIQDKNNLLDEQIHDCLGQKYVSQY